MSGPIFNNNNNIVPPDFDPLSQTFTLLLPDGTPFNASMADVQYLVTSSVRTSINYGTQIGTSIILLLVLLLLTRRDKRRSALFIMNALCLAINAIRSILQVVYFDSNWWNVYTLLSGDYSRVTSMDRANSIASNTLTLLLVICILISLSMQVWVVCTTTPMIQRIAIMSMTTAIALIAIGYRFALVIINNARIADNSGIADKVGLQKTVVIVQTVAIWVYCAIFTFKLGHALIQRRRLGMTQFGPMQIIFIMGCQTMIIPAIFSILQFCYSDLEFSTQTLTMVCIFLPLSAIWAGVVVNDATLGSSGADSHQMLLRGQFGRSPHSSPTPSRLRHAYGHGEKYTTATSMYSHAGKEPESPATQSSFVRAKQEVDGGIMVDRAWQVEKGEASNAV
ncbi:hypothetical protein P154DRAFT_570966 [Amniculicola lignicola CBS 123094]|uniref:Pheromone alpha factor receptor n=1 Tax=Amniculicola lignicola CBS 123094 TaxID=1392246 RepID=A0A6A5X2K5_9PLEO|nr:hypothetical protein P154DRAFT_570966 [Amniculicola lignicola CBS 123094]